MREKAKGDFQPPSKARNGEGTMRLKGILQSTIILGGIVFGGTSTVAYAAEYEWKFFTYFVTNSTPAAINRAFAEDVSKSSDGRLQIDVFTAGELPYKPTDVIKAVATNKVQMADAAIGFVAGDAPALNILSLPFVCTSYDGFSQVVPHMQPILERELSSKFGIRPVMNWTMPPQNIWMVEPISTLAELEGKKVRAWNPLQVEMLELVDASAISMAGSEVPSGLQRKVIDGAITSALSVADWKLSEAVKGGFITNFMMGHQFTLVNEEALAELPDDLQRLVMIKAKEYQARFAAEIELSDTQARMELEKAGMTMSEISEADSKKIRSLLAPMADQWSEKNGPVAKELLELVRANCSS